MWNQANILKIIKMLSAVETCSDAPNALANDNKKIN